MEGREAYMAFKSDFFTHCHDLPPQLGGCAMTPEGEKLASKIDGTDGSSWTLPLEPITKQSLEPLSTGDNPPYDRFIAASKLVGNHKAVTKFALRGVGQPGKRPVSAPLSDPTAEPGMQHEPEVDLALRHVAHLMLTGAVENGSHENSGIDTSASLQEGMIAASGVPGSLAYLRDRVGVPRDMPLPAARQFRAHLNWMIDHVSL
jgi:glutathione S-transferase